MRVREGQARMRVHAGGAGAYACACVRGGRMRPERASSGLEPQLDHLGSVWPWAGYSNSLGLSFPMCGPGMGLR